MRVINVFYEVDENKELKIVLVKQKGNKKFVEVRKSSILPYFYSPVPILHPKIVRIEKIKAINGEFYKCVVKFPEDVREVRRGDSRECDLPFHLRWLLDTRIDLGKEPLTKIYIDIEADNPPSRFPDFEKDRILSIAIYNDKIQKVFYIEDYPSEKELLLDFLKTVLPYSCVIAWNLNGFDLPYLKTRIKVNKLGWKWMKYWVWLDLMDLYKRFVTSYSKQQIVTSYALEHVAHLELGMEKEEKKKLFSRNREEVIKYNLNDARLIYLIDKKVKLTDLIDSFSKISNLLPQDCLYFSRIVQLMVMRELKGKYIFSRYTPYKSGESYSGGWVLDAPTGVFRWVAFFDFSSLYPNIIRTFNISIETFDSKGKIISPNNKRFRDDIVGVYPKILERFMELRSKFKQKFKETKNEIYKTLDIGCKFLLCSFYGVLGFRASRIFNEELAETVTFTGRWLLNYLKSISEELGYRVLYGDTDSLAIQLKCSKKEEALQEAEKLTQIFNERLKDLSNKFNLPHNYLSLKVDEIFEKIFFYGKKKRYFGKIVWDGDWCEKFFARGLEIRRTDWCELAVEYEQKILELLLEDVKKAEDFHKKFIENIRKQPLRKFVIYKSLTRQPNEYKVKPLHAQLANDSDFIGSKIGYIITDSRDKLKAERWEEGKNIVPDYRYYVINQIGSIYTRLLEPLTNHQTNIIKYLNK